MRPCAWLLLLCLLCRASLAIAQPSVGGSASLVRRPLPAVKASAPPAIDGDLSDPVWQSAARADVFSDRLNGGTHIDQTTALLLFDEKYIYVGFRCTDSAPAQVVGRETIRDSRYANMSMDNTESEDCVELVLDPFLAHRYQDLTRFSVNPIGTRSARIGGGRANKSEWKGDWTAAAKRTEDGWTAEMRIPWEILNYPASAGPTTFGVNFGRYQYHTQTNSIWSNTGNQGFLELEGLWTGLQVPSAAFKPKLSLLPYVMPGAWRADGTLRSGMDARYTLSPKLTAVGSINPDFATIEGAVEGIQFSRTERFVPERRPFFLEGSDYLSAGDFFSIGRYFYANHIETFDSGFKLYGKLTPQDSIGILNAADFHTRNDLVARFRHDLSPTANLGIFLLDKSAIDDFNRVEVLDGRNRWGKFTVSGQLALTQGRDAGGGAHQLAFDYEDRNQELYLQLLNVDPSFRDADGLIGFTDYRGLHAFGYSHAQWRKGFWRDYSVFVVPELDWHRDGRPFRRGGNVQAQWSTRSDWSIGLNANHEKYDDQTDETYGISVRSGATNRFRQWGFDLMTGRSANNPYTYIGPAASVRLLRRLDLAYGGAVQNFEGHTHQHVLTMGYEISPTRSFGGRVVVQDANTNWYLSYRSSGEKGTEMYFIFGDPNAPRFTQRAAVKFVFAI